MIDLAGVKDWVQICEVCDGEIRFTKEYLVLTECLGNGARKFAAHLATNWDKVFENTLDYFGPDDAETDWYTGVNGDAMDVNEDIPEYCEVQGKPFADLDKEWHRDLFRARLVTLRLPKRLIEEYVKLAQKYANS